MENSIFVAFKYVYNFIKEINQCESLEVNGFLLLAGIHVRFMGDSR